MLLHVFCVLISLFKCTCNCAICSNDVYCLIAPSLFIICKLSETLQYSIEVWWNKGVVHWNDFRNNCFNVVNKLNPQIQQVNILFVCLRFLWSLSRIFHANGNVTIIGEGLQIWHSWPLSSEGSLACPICYDMGHPFVMVISEDLWHLHLLPSI